MNIYVCIYIYISQVYRGVTGFSFCDIMPCMVTAAATKCIYVTHLHACNRLLIAKNIKEERERVYINVHRGS